MPRNRERCHADIYRPGRELLCRCPNKAKIERHGKLYCGVHDPDAITRRRQKNHLAFWRAPSAHTKQTDTGGME